MAISLAEARDIARSKPAPLSEKALEERIDAHMVSRLFKEPKLKTIEWGIPYDLPLNHWIVVSLISKYEAKGWTVTYNGPYHHCLIFVCS